MVEDDEKPWYRPLLVGLGALLGVAVLVGGLIGVVALGVVNVAGVGEERATVEEEPSLHIPDRTPGQRTEDDDQGLTLEDLNGGVDPTESESPSESASPSAEPKKKKKRKPPKSVISLSASPVEVAPMERIYLTGTYPGGEGASLQVQRFEGGWQNFDASASVSGGTFSSYVMTGRSGPNKFRVVDPASGKASNPVTIRVR